MTPIPGEGKPQRPERVPSSELDSGWAARRTLWLGAKAWGTGSIKASLASKAYRTAWNTTSGKQGNTVVLNEARLPRQSLASGVGRVNQAQGVTPLWTS